MSKEPKAKPYARTVTWDGNLQISKGDEVKILRGIVSPNDSIRASVIENVTTGREETSGIEGILMTRMPFDINPPITGIIQKVSCSDGATVFQLAEGIGVLEVKFRKLVQLASPFLDKEIVEECINKEKGEDVVTSSFRILEERIRKKIGATPDRSGVDLINDAFNSKSGKLVIGKTPSESEGAYQLFRGSILFLRNPPAHRYIDEYSDFEIFEIVMHVNLLLSILDKC